MRKLFLPLTVLLCCTLAGLSENRPTKAGPSDPLPRIVARFARFGQTHQISTEPIFIPTDFGMYRLSYVMVVTKGDQRCTGTWFGKYQWTDGSGLKSGNYPINCNEPQSTAFDYPVRAIKGKPISFGVQSNGTVTGSRYNVFFVVEKIM